jgi:serine/threonine protein kinase
MRTIGPFEIHEPLARGGHAVVHVARWSGAGDSTADRLVAKLALPGAELTLHAENSALRAVEHPNVIAPVGFVDDSDSVVLVLPRAACSLTAHIGLLDEGQVAALLVPLADALAELHRAGVAHGDISPANVLLHDDGSPVLTDFGRALPVSPSAAAADVVGLAHAAMSALLPGTVGPLRELLAAVMAEPCDAAAFGECVDALGIEPRPIDVSSVPAVAIEPPTIIVDQSSRPRG